ncbi:MAG: thioesterase family protein [Candidatus Cloacimonetes bacterium]|jgi:acyl-CoA thioester hydrolase|nr:thioesterase family protein [Candidatus Cloacimonadota bacterium]
MERLNMKVTEVKIRVRYKETDQMGVVHHSNYYTWFEVARTEFMRNAGMNYRQMEEKGVMLPLLETHCSYLKGARYDDLVTVRTWVSKYAGIRLTMEFEVIRDEDGVMLAKGSTVHAFTDNKLKPLNIKRKYPEIHKLFIDLIK